MDSSPEKRLSEAVRRRSSRGSAGGEVPEWAENIDTMGRVKRQSDSWRRQLLDEQLLAIREDLAEWLNQQLELNLTESSLFAELSTGVILCRIAQKIESTAADPTPEERGRAEKNIHYNKAIWSSTARKVGDGTARLRHFTNAKAGSFQARDNAAKFLNWCTGLGLPDVMLFESNDLVDQKSEKPVMFLLLEIARLAATVGIEPSQLIALEIEIEEEMRNDEDSGLIPADTQFVASEMSDANEVESAPSELPALLEEDESKGDVHDVPPHEEPMLHESDSFDVTIQLEDAPSPSLSGIPLGMSSGEIPDIAISASVSMETARFARLNGANSAWTPSSSQRSEPPFLQIDTGSLSAITGFQMQGHPEKEFWVTLFSVSSSVDGNTWVPLLGGDRSTLQLETGISASSEPANVPLPDTLFTRFLRIHVLESELAPALRCEVFGFRCGTPLGLADFSVPAVHITASSTSMSSSSSGEQSSPHFARLNCSGAWSPVPDDSEPYIVVDMGSYHQVTGFLVQGHPTRAAWIESFAVDLSLDGKAFSPLVDEGSQDARIFSANRDEKTIVPCMLPLTMRPCVARYVRLSILSWETEPALRFEILVKSVGVPLVQANEVTEAHFSASSERDRDHHRAAFSRYHPESLFPGKFWLPRDKFAGTFLDIDLGVPRLVRALLVRGDEARGTFASQFCLLGSTSESFFEEFQGIHFSQSSASLTAHVLPTPLVARKLRICPIACKTLPTLQVEILAEDVGLPVGVQSGAVLDAQLQGSPCENGEDSEPREARLFSPRAWRPASSSEAFLEIHFDCLKHVKMLALQGDPVRKNCFITEFVLESSMNGETWFPVQRDGNLAGFKCDPSCDPDGISFCALPGTVPVLATAIRIWPTAFSGERVALRAEVFVSDVGPSSSALMQLGLAEAFPSSGDIIASERYLWVESGTAGDVHLDLDLKSPRYLDAVLVNFEQDANSAGQKPKASSPDYFELYTSFDGERWRPVGDRLGSIKRFPLKTKGEPVCPLTAHALPDGSPLARFVRLSPKYSSSSSSPLGPAPLHARVEVFSKDLGQLALPSSEEANTSSSSSISSERGAEQAAVFGPVAWQPAREDGMQFVQLDLKEPRLVTSVLTEGGAVGHVTTYVLEWSLNGSLWLPYRELGEAKVFAANSGADMPASQTLKATCIARHVRITPTSWQKSCELRFGVLSTSVGKEVGLVDGSISDDSIAASSTLSSFAAAAHARLFSDRGMGCWMPAKGEETRSVLEVRLGRLFAVNAIALQRGGLQAGQTTQDACSSVLLEFTLDGASWAPLVYSAGSRIARVSHGCDSVHELVCIGLPQPVLATAVRVSPKSFQGSGPAIRLAVFAEDLGRPVGIESGAVPDTALRSSLDDAERGNLAARARLNGCSSWAVELPDGTDLGSNFIEVDIGRTMEVTAILTQGAPDAKGWVTSYAMETSIDSESWTPYTSLQGSMVQVRGNFYGADTSGHLLTPGQSARFVRLWPLTFGGSLPCLRFEVYGRLARASQQQPQSPRRESGEADNSQIKNAALAAALEAYEAEVGRLCEVLGSEFDRTRVLKQGLEDGISASTDIVRPEISSTNMDTEDMRTVMLKRIQVVKGDLVSRRGALMPKPTKEELAEYEKDVTRLVEKLRGEVRDAVDKTRAGTDKLQDLWSEVLDHGSSVSAGVGLWRKDCESDDYLTGSVTSQSLAPLRDAVLSLLPALPQEVATSVKRRLQVGDGSVSDAVRKRDQLNVGVSHLDQRFVATTEQTDAGVQDTVEVSEEAIDEVRRAAQLALEGFSSAELQDVGGAEEARKKRKFRRTTVIETVEIVTERITQYHEWLENVRRRSSVYQQGRSTHRRIFNMGLDLSGVKHKIDTSMPSSLRTLVERQRSKSSFEGSRDEERVRASVPAKRPHQPITHAPLDLSNIKAKIDTGGTTRVTAVGPITSPNLGSERKTMSLSVGKTEDLIELRRRSLPKKLTPYHDPVDEEVSRQVNECSCRKAFKVLRIGQGKYVFGDSDKTVFIRVVRDHVMVRIGGGWDTLASFLLKIDPCRKDGRAASPEKVPRPEAGTPPTSAAAADKARPAKPDPHHRHLESSKQARHAEGNGMDTESLSSPDRPSTSRGRSREDVVTTPKSLGSPKAGRLSRQASGGTAAATPPPQPPPPIMPRQPSNRTRDTSHNVRAALDRSDATTHIATATAVSLDDTTVAAAPSSAPLSPKAPSSPVVASSTTVTTKTRSFERQPSIEGTAAPMSPVRVSVIEEVKVTEEVHTQDEEPGVYVATTVAAVGVTQAPLPARRASIGGGAPSNRRPNVKAAVQASLSKAGSQGGVPSAGTSSSTSPASGGATKLDKSATLSPASTTTSPRERSLSVSAGARRPSTTASTSTSTPTSTPLGRRGSTSTSSSASASSRRLSVLVPPVVKEAVREDAGASTPPKSTSAAPRSRSMTLSTAEVKARRASAAPTTIATATATATAATTTGTSGSARRNSMIGGRPLSMAADPSQAYQKQPTAAAGTPAGKGKAPANASSSGSKRT